jgi:hypothetical protein
MVKSASPQASPTSNNAAGGSQHRAATKATAAVAEAVRRKLVSDIQNGFVRRIRSRSVPPPKAVTSREHDHPEKIDSLVFRREHSRNGEYGDAHVFKEVAHEFGIVLRSNLDRTKSICAATVSYFS